MKWSRTDLSSRPANQDSAEFCCSKQKNSQLCSRADAQICCFYLPTPSWPGADFVHFFLSVSYSPSFFWLYKIVLFFFFADSLQKIYAGSLHPWTYSLITAILCQFLTRSWIFFLCASCLNDVPADSIMNNVFQRSDLALLSFFHPSLCTAVGWTHAHCSSLLTLRTYSSLKACCSENGTDWGGQPNTFQDFRSVVERAWKPHHFSSPPPLFHLRCSISLTLTFGAPGSWFTHHQFVKLQHGCDLKKSSHAINHNKCQLLLLASSVRLLMRQSYAGPNRELLFPTCLPSEVSPFPPLCFPFPNSAQ